MSFQLRQPVFGSNRSSVQISLFGGVRSSSGPDAYLPPPLGIC